MFIEVLIVESSFWKKYFSQRNASTTFSWFSTTFSYERELSLTRNAIAVPIPEQKAGAQQTDSMTLKKETAHFACRSQLARPSGKFNLPNG